MLRVKRVKIDANRDVADACQGSAFSEQVWRLYHSCIEQAVTMAARTHGFAHVFDIHGQAHRAAIEVGNLLSGHELEHDDHRLHGMRTRMREHAPVCSSGPQGTYGTRRSRRSWRSRSRTARAGLSCCAAASVWARIWARCVRAGVRAPSPPPPERAADDASSRAQCGYRAVPSPADPSPHKAYRHVSHRVPCAVCECTSECCAQECACSSNAFQLMRARADTPEAREALEGVRRRPAKCSACGPDEVVRFFSGGYTTKRFSGGVPECNTPQFVSATQLETPVDVRADPTARAAFARALAASILKFVRFAYRWDWAGGTVEQ